MNLMHYSDYTDKWIIKILKINFQCFVCSTEKEFDDLCNRLRHDLVDTEKTPLLELASTRPHYMRDSPVEGASGKSNT